ncbi:AMP-binding protein [Actinomadura yumaensis]|uniref:AMP-binding protein n=1 Tax=Actinomadura yumaensis TaxID=111807 RepID=UPI00360CA130
MLDRYPGPPAVSETSVTGAVLAAARDHAARRGDRPALACPGEEVGYARFAATVPAAADGMRRLGVRPGDVAAVHLAGACDLALAVHAVTAAGAVPAPLPLDGGVGDLAAALTETGARFLFTARGTSARSLAAAERSFVRQVFAFGDVPGTTPFARLVRTGAHAAPAEPLPGPAADPLRDLALLLNGPAGEVSHADRLADLYRLGGTVGLSDGDVLVCCGRDCTLDVDRPDRPVPHPRRHVRRRPRPGRGGAARRRPRPRRDRRRGDAREAARPDVRPRSRARPRRAAAGDRRGASRGRPGVPRPPRLDRHALG